MKLDFVLQWSATFLTILGALFTSLNIYPANVIAFNIGGVFWLWFAYRAKIKSLVVVNASLLIIYVIGAVRALM